MLEKNVHFKRINYCGCYKISEDSRMWICSSFKQGILIYIHVEDFGKDLDIEKFIEPEERIEEVDDTGPSEEILGEILADKTLDEE